MARIRNRAVAAPQSFLPMGVRERCRVCARSGALRSIVEIVRVARCPRRRPSRGVPARLTNPGQVRRGGQRAACPGLPPRTGDPQRRDPRLPRSAAGDGPPAFCLRREDHEPSIVRAVRGPIETHRKTDSARLNDVARALGLTPRTLQRKLGEVQINYSRLLDATRREMTERYLLDESLSLRRDRRSARLQGAEPLQRRRAHLVRHHRCRWGRAGGEAGG